MTHQKLEWQVTEDGESEYEYLEGNWTHGSRHRKYCNVLNFADFCDFIEHVGIYVEKCHTMGSLGAPGLGFGLSPAVPFQSDDPNAIQSAYVTPIPPEMMSDWVSPGPLLPGMPEDLLDPCFEPVEAAMWEWFDDGRWSAEREVEALTNAEVAV